MDKKVIRVYFSGYVDKELPENMEDPDKIYEIKEELCATLTAEDIGRCMTEDDWQVYP
jgi:hypothetical protein